jgi:hypothetical protein
MTNYRDSKQILLFMRLFIVLFLILFILPMLIDNVLSMFMLYQSPKGDSMLVSKNLYDGWSFGKKYLFILKNVIINL